MSRGAIDAPFEPAVFAAEFDARLAEHGVDAGTSRALACARLLQRAAPSTLDTVYWCARIAMLPSIADLDRFHLAFAATCAAATQANASGDPIWELPRAAPPEKGTALRPRTPDPSERRARGADDRDTAVFVAMASADERLFERDIAEMSETELELARRAAERLSTIFELRRSRRRRTARRGTRLDLRATLREAARTAGELVRRRNSLRRDRLRPLVFLCDVSGSMAPYARVVLGYARANALARGRVRAFAFATRLTELTASIGRSGKGDVLSAVLRELPDYGGGTRIGAALQAFNAHYAQRGAARGGTVVILSDGWEREEPGLVASEMARLRRLSRRIVWVNPQKKHPGFEPLARGMAAALPFVDALVAGHNLRSLEGIARAVEAAGYGARRRRAAKRMDRMKSLSSKSGR